MAEKSLFWFTDGFTGATGDGSAPYTQEEFSDRNRLTLGEGVISASGTGNSLFPHGEASPISVTDGSAIIRGFHYSNTDTETLAVATPVVNTTGGRVVLRADYDAATVRIAVKLSADGVAAIPTLTQIANDVWEINLGTFTITTGGVISIDDDNAKSRFAFTRLAGPDGITLDRDLERRFQIADGGVTAAKVGEGVPVLTDRQGGDATRWDTAGTSNYTVGNVIMQAGVGVDSWPSAASLRSVNVTFPVAFAQRPLVIATISDISGILPIGAGKDINIQQIVSTTTGAGINMVVSDNSGLGSDRDVSVSWLAIGEPA